MVTPLSAVANGPPAVTCPTTNAVASWKSTSFPVDVACAAKVSTLLVASDKSTLPVVETAPSALAVIAAVCVMLPVACNRAVPTPALITELTVKFPPSTSTAMSPLPLLELSPTTASKVPTARFPPPETCLREMPPDVDVNAATVVTLVCSGPPLVAIPVAAFRVS